ncbi:uncharacterized protein HMPREF1541_01199 [Cyphellophora europaea CBS 101466]|uniref:Zn(2)-C6 fungal-type domain-containing protein n=1 Tax=Cyphellophora europaea (strain CBS 101466) TaxID=1220924 RepID=W2SGK6_CYPE1|nr:uncharacterized protein HMPREF1541_01199 [Cyphellophora europaea CBS 101466]ETN47009.1 hypothetical protein HMPREF1541_01199 [Cyphellophora europaea CBS 101466]
MSGFFEPSTNVPPGHMNDPGGYQMYNNQYNNGQYPRLGGPNSHFDGVAFWYRPETQEPIYERDPSLYNQAIGLPQNTMEATGVKHRRTRSGCFTCRSRRVKCDETRPVCERCRKGGRECEFPQPSSSSSSSSKRTKSEAKSPTTASRKHEKSDSKESTGLPLETIKDEDEDASEPPSAASTSSRRPTLSKVRTASTQSLSRKQRYRHGSEPSPTFKDKSSPQSASSSSSHSRAETPASSMTTGAPSADIQARQAKIKSLKPDIQKYFQFQQDHLTYYHYFFKLDPTDWIHNDFIEEALSYEPLLYAAVGFAAYHYEVRQPDAKLGHFLKYHSRAISLLRKSIESSQPLTPTLLLTVLQLATFEECLGDWVNLVAHHRAAHSMLTQLYTPESVQATLTGRMLFTWFARMDVIASLMGGKDASLPRVWYEANAIHAESQIDTDPENDVDIDGHLLAFVASNRLIGYDMAKLYARVPTGDISLEELHLENDKIVERLRKFKSNIEKLNDGYYTVQEFPAANDWPLTDADIVDPYIPGGLFRDALWPMNFMWIDWYAIDMMQRYQLSLILRQPVPEEMERLALEQCRIYEAVARWPDAPEGSILGAHASIALAAVFLKKDERHTMWMRRKLANVERLGYVFPPHYRSQMARVWGLTADLVGEDESVEGWWLPNDEGKLPILGEIRKVVSDRNKAGEDSGILNKEVEDVRDIKAIFAKLDLRTQHSRAGAGLRSGSFNSVDDLSFSPQESEGQRSEVSTAIGSPASAASAKEEGWERWEGAASSAPEPTINTTSRGEERTKEKDEASSSKAKDPNRMSGLWS